MEPYEVSKKIDDICKTIHKKAAEIAKFASSEKLPLALAEYDKAMELAIIQLHGEGVPTTTIRDRAKGMCKEQLYAVKSLEIKWKAMLSIFEATKARLNGYQTINRHLSEM